MNTSGNINAIYNSIYNAQVNDQYNQENQEQDSLRDISIVENTEFQEYFDRAYINHHKEYFEEPLFLSKDEMESDDSEDDDTRSEESGKLIQEFHIFLTFCVQKKAKEILNHQDILKIITMKDNHKPHFKSRNALKLMQVILA